jgi:DNA-directed RNA polymerase specialized sigma24 family protein
MVKASKKRHPLWDETNGLAQRLVKLALRYFASEKCYGANTVLPGVSTTVEDLVEDTIVSLIKEGYWKSNSDMNEVWRIARTIMRRDFLDLIKSPKYKAVDVRDPNEDEQLRNACIVFDFEQIEAKLTVESFRRVLVGEELVYLDLLLRGLKTIEIAREMKLPEQKVVNIRRRVIYKIQNMEKRFWANKDR